MFRRFSSFRFAFLLGCLAWFAAPAPAAEPTGDKNESSKLNVLFIAVDDLRPELGCYGNTEIKSPHIDRLAASGVTFTRAYCQEALCNPSRASLMTGLRPDTTRVWDLPTHFRTTRPETVTIPQAFMRNGYRTLSIGKIFHHNLPDPVSWQETLDIAGYPFYPAVVYRDPKTAAQMVERRKELLAKGYTEEDLYKKGHTLVKFHATECADVPDNAYFDGAQTDVAIEKLEELQKQGKPFFFGVGYHRPHLPFIAPKKYWDLYDREKISPAKNDFLPKGAPSMAVNTLQELHDYEDMTDIPQPYEGPIDEKRARLLRHGYYACVSYTDAQIGRLLDKLHETGLDKNTIVVLWGDHGWKLGEHRSWGKMTNFEIDTHAPLIVRMPGAKENGKKCDQLVEFVDIYPTLCELAGFKGPAELEGASFAPLLRDADRPWKQAVFSQYLRNNQWLGPDGIEYAGYTIRTPKWRWVEWYRWDAENQKPTELVGRELYDETADPDENVNLADSPEHAATAAELAKQLKAGWRAFVPKQNWTGLK